jgi:hypothetical protein
LQTWFALGAYPAKPRPLIAITRKIFAGTLAPNTASNHLDCHSLISSDDLPRQKRLRVRQ